MSKKDLLVILSITGFVLLCEVIGGLLMWHNWHKGLN